LTGQGKSVLRAGWGIFYDAFSQDIFLGHLPWNCVFCPGPAYPGLGPQALATGGATAQITPGAAVYSGYAPEGDFFSADPNIRTPYVQNFNFNFQQQVVNKVVAEIGYIGSRGTKLFQFYDINQPSHAQITAADLANGVSGYGVPRQYANLFYIN